MVAAFAGRRFPCHAGTGWASPPAWGRLTYPRVVGLLHNPAYAGAYAYGRTSTRQQVDPDGTVRTHIRTVTRDQWQVLIRDHHEGYISWQGYLAIQDKMAANQSSRGARPPREGQALCQGIIYCGCGRHMGVKYDSNGRAYYSCRTRSELLTTPQCQHASAATVDAVVTQALFTALQPSELALAITAAGEVTARRQRANRAAELAVQRARYHAGRAERAFHACEPENRLVARTLETRWEAQLAELADAEAALAAQLREQAPLPEPAELRDTAASLPALWHAPTTTAKDRKRLLRTLLGDVTLMPAADPAQLKIGLRWNSGATEEITTGRYHVQRTSTAAITLARQLGPAMDNTALATALNAAGHHTAHGRPFTAESAGNLRNYHKITYPAQLAHGELTVAQAATRTGVSAQTIKYWIDRGYLTARHAPGRTLAIPFPPDVEAACRQRAASSSHQHKDITSTPRGDNEHTVTETAASLGTTRKRIYDWIKNGTLQARRGPGAHHLITLTPGTEAHCRRLITGDATTDSTGKPASP